MLFNAWSLAAPILNTITGVIKESKGEKFDWAKHIASSALMIAKHGPMKAGTHSKVTKSQHAGEGTQGVQPPSNPSNIHGAATTTGNQGAAHKARLEGLKANQQALKIQQQKQALPPQANAPAASSGRNPNSPSSLRQSMMVAGLRPDGSKGPNKVGDTNKGHDGKEYILKPREGYGYNQWVPTAFRDREVNFLG